MTVGLDKFETKLLLEPSGLFGVEDGHLMVFTSREGQSTSEDEGESNPPRVTFH